MKYFIIIVLLLWASGCSSNDPDFRSVDWGMTKEQVKNLEEEPLESEEDEVLKYKCYVLREETELMYAFEDDRLIQGGYMRIGYGIFESVNSIRKVLFKKYGKPDEIDGTVQVWHEKDTTIKFFTADDDGDFPFYTLIYSEKQYMAEWDKNHAAKIRGKTECDY